MRIHVQSTGNAAVAHIDVDGPEGAVLDMEVTELHVLAAVELDEVRAHVGFAFLHPAVLHRDAGRTHGVELPRGLDVRFRTREPGTPELHFRMDEPRAADTDVLAFIGIQERGVVHAFRALPGTADGGQVELGVVLEHELGPFGEP